jgi:ferredoxin
MALKITNECINCDVCEPVCPNQAIYQGVDIYEINPSLCTECIGHFDEPQCQIVCPVACIEQDLTINETEEQLFDKYNKISNNK